MRSDTKWDRKGSRSSNLIIASLWLPDKVKLLAVRGGRFNQWQAPKIPQAAKTHQRHVPMSHSSPEQRSKPLHYNSSFQPPLSKKPSNLKLNWGSTRDITIPFSALHDYLHLQCQRLRFQFLRSEQQLISAPNS